LDKNLQIIALEPLKRDEFLAQKMYFDEISFEVLFLWQKGSKVERWQNKE